MWSAPANLDLARSRLTLNAGASPIALLRSSARYFASYPYQCSEQVASSLTPLLALYRARRAAGAEAGDTLLLRREIATGVATLLRRQRPNGGIGLWSAEDWTSPWLSAHAGSVLLEAREAGFALGFRPVANFLNVTLPPFDKQEAREAFNYAVDSRALVRVFGGRLIDTARWLQEQRGKPVPSMVSKAGGFPRISAR